MICIIAGSREIEDYSILDNFIKENKLEGKITEVVSGGARGVDRLGEEWARNHDLKVTNFQAHWLKHGKAAGPIRNKQMADYADMAVILWDGKSKGTRNMIGHMKKQNKLLYVCGVSDD